MMNAVQEAEPLHKIGDNNPPEPTPFEAIKSEIESLYEEAKNWCDGAGVETQAQADDLQKLLRMIQAAEKKADDLRKDEARPHDEAKAAIQERYNALIGKTKAITGVTVMAIEACKKALAPWLVKVEAENQRKAEEARKAADAKAEEMRAAMQKRDSLENIETAETLFREAKAADTSARRAENTKATAKGQGRAVSLRDRYTPEIVDYTIFARYVWQEHRKDIEAFLNDHAVSLVAAGKRSGIPGVFIKHERVPV